MRQIIIVLILILLTACSGTTRKERMVNRAEWMLGEWMQTSDAGTLSESWKKVNDSVFAGGAYFVKGEDTLHHERIRLYQKEDVLMYEATVTGQNDNMPVVFPCTVIKENLLTFSNPQHDYPQTITYRLINRDSLVATISGKQQGKPVSQSYGMRKKS